MTFHFILVVSGALLLRYRITRAADCQILRVISTIFKKIIKKCLPTVRATVGPPSSCAEFNERGVQERTE